jgi:pimeloyl-ACP methyl ester carboxylesterase
MSDHRNAQRADAIASAATYYAHAGSGPRVLCLHSFASNSSQYRSVMDRLASRFAVVAPDLYGHGRSAPWPAERRFTLADEAAPLEALLPEEPPVHLIGHSYGGAVALRIAAANRTRVRSLVLYEPAMWGTLAHLCPHDDGTREIEGMRDETNALIDAGRLEAAAERFIDYWGGAGTWAATPSHRRPKLLDTVRSLREVWKAAFTERWSVSALRALDIPCLLLSGTTSTLASRRAFRLLAENLPRAHVIELDGLNHLGPITHPELVNPLIEAFLKQVSETPLPAELLALDGRLPFDR